MGAKVALPPALTAAGDAALPFLEEDYAGAVLMTFNRALSEEPAEGLTGREDHADFMAYLAHGALRTVNCRAPGEPFWVGDDVLCVPIPRNAHEPRAAAREFARNHWAGRNVSGLAAVTIGADPPVWPYRIWERGRA